MFGGNGVKGNYITIVTACVLAILVGFFSGYEAATYNVKVGNEVSTIKNAAKNIGIESLEFKDIVSDGLTTLEFCLGYNISGKTTSKNYQKHLSFKFMFSNKTKDILGEETSDELNDYKLAAMKKSYNEYTLNYILHLKELKKEDLDYLKSNFKKDTQIYIYIDNKLLKKLKF